MLYENDVVHSVATYLKANGYMIESACYGYDKGHDLVASNGLEKLYIEAKGETSQDPTTKRFGEAFTSTQVLDHVAKAWFKCCQVLSEHENRSEVIGVGLALPDNDPHRYHIGKIKNVLSKLNVKIYWVQSNKTVIVETAAEGSAAG